VQSSPPKKDDISFLSVASKGIFKIIFIILIVVIVSTTVTAVYLSSAAPANYGGDAEYARFEIVIPETAEPPLAIHLSHTYPIKAELIGFYITDGPDLIEYTLMICNTRGDEVFSEKSSLIMPERISTYRGDTDYTVSTDLSADLSPGTYHVYLRADHPVQYSIGQHYKYQTLNNASFGLAILGMVLLVALSIGVLKKRDSLRNQRNYALWNTNYGVTTDTVVQYGYAPAGAAGHPQNPVYQSMAEEPVDYLCAKCGNIIQNPVVQNVITCEKCGEKEYVGR
jgi:DNA-directed RNA polymerase subunit RPC12/RpoP